MLKEKLIYSSHSLEMNDLIWCQRFDVNRNRFVSKSEGIVYLCSNSNATFTLSFGKQEAIEQIVLNIRCVAEKCCRSSNMKRTRERYMHNS